MDIKSLMIGDWMYVNPWDDKKPTYPSRVTGINYNSWSGEDFCDWVDCEVWDEISLDKIRPIPLTNEILEKNGFSCKGHDHYHFECGDCYVLAAYPRLGGSTEIFFQSHKMKYRGVIRFVHELQHALRQCEIDKDIVINKKE